MAETAPLTLAYSHARKAIEEQQKTHWSQAAEAHHQASTDFSKTARGTTDSEAIRVLKLLEAEHRKLARLVKSYDVPATIEPAAEETKASASVTTTSLSPQSSGSDKAKATTTALSGTRVGSHVRDTSPSLARDIASRRGIPPPSSRGPPSAAAQARARPGSPTSQRKTSSSLSASRNPPSILDNQTSPPNSKWASSKAVDDEGFAKFYSSITSGTMSKLTSALAFAGLPLVASDEAAMNSPPHSTQQSQNLPLRRTVTATHEPDVKKLFSPAALAAVEDEHRRRGTFGHGFGPAESFYVVQKGGGTYSYADIARAQQQQQQKREKGEEVVEDDDDDEGFVDAREVPGSPVRRRDMASTSAKAQHPSTTKAPARSAFGQPRTPEELELENATLKQTLEQIATRLAVFEAHAQDASMAALTQSMVGLPNVGGGGAVAAGAVGGTGERVSQLQRQLERQTDEQRRLESVVAKQKETLQRYHAKWEEVKKSAKEKDRAKRARGERDASRQGESAVAAGAVTETT